MVLFSNILNYGKLIGASVLAGLVFFGWYKYSSKVKEVDELKSYANKKDREAQALKSTNIVQEKIHKQALANIVMEKDVSDNEVKLSKRQIKKTEDLSSKVQEATKGKSFSLKA